METPLRNVEQAVAIQQAVGFPFLTDLLVRTSQQIAGQIQIGDPFFLEILPRGKVLYEADCGRAEGRVWMVKHDESGPRASV